MFKTKSEGIQWILTIMNTLHDAVDVFGKVNEKLPEELKRKIPGLLGLSLADEQIFGALMGQIKDKKKQVLINKFLYEKCTKYERERFIVVVAGMEVIPGKQAAVEEKLDPKTGKVTSKKKTLGKRGADYRLKFLESFGDVMKDEFGEDLDKTYKFCVGMRLIIEDPLREKVGTFISGIVNTPKQTTAAFKQSGSQYLADARARRKK